MATFTDYALLLSAAVLGIAALRRFYWAFGDSRALVALKALPDAAKIRARPFWFLCLFLGLAGLNAGAPVLFSMIG
ncbi:MAG: hypothetical protein ABL907_03750 [Hyphomicrobium sp.]